MPIERTDNKPGKWFVTGIPINFGKRAALPVSHPRGIDSVNPDQAASDTEIVVGTFEQQPVTIFSADKLKNRKPSHPAFNNGAGYNPMTNMYDYGLTTAHHVPGVVTAPSAPDVLTPGKSQDFPGDA